MRELIKGQSTDRPMPEPSLAGWEALYKLMRLARKNPKKFERRVSERLALAEAHKLNAGVMRLRSARYDAKVDATREEWINFTLAIAATCRMQAGLTPPEITPPDP